MKQISVSMPWKPCDIWFLGDLQWAGKKANSTALDRLRQTIEDAMEAEKAGREVRFVGMGDYIDFASPSNRARLKAATLYDTATDIIDDKALELTQEIYELALKPTCGKWLGLVEGHHLHELKDGTTTDMRLCEMLDATFLGTTGLVRLAFKLKAGNGLSVVLWIHHGTGSGQTGYYPLTRLEKKSAEWEQVDVFAMGHTTKMVTGFQNKVYPRWSPALDLAHRKVILIGTGGYCVPLDAEILTACGWQSHGELRAGQTVLGWEDGLGLVWTRLTGISRFHRQVTDRLSSRSFDAICTREHMWETDRLRVETHHLRIADRIRVAAGSPCLDSGTIVMSPEEATLLAWVVTDGYVTASRGLTIGISQWKEPYRTHIRQSLAKWVRSESGHTFLLHVAKFQDLCWRVGTDPRRLKLDQPRLVAAMSPEARAAWFTTCLEAEGSRDAGGWSFWQNVGPVLDAFEIAATLEGWRVGRSAPRGRYGRNIRLRLHRRTHVTVSDVKKTRAGVRDVWCPETETGNWVMRWRGHITLTGNSKTYVLGALQGRVPRGGYAEQRMMNAAIIGSPVLHIRPRVRQGYLSVDLTAEG